MTMTEEELRAINPEEFECKDIAWQNEEYYKFTGRVIFDYDIGLSILDRENPEFCLTGIHGPEYKGISNYKSKEEYHKMLELSFSMIRDRFYDVKLWLTKFKINQSGKQVTCSFS